MRNSVKIWLFGVALGCATYMHAIERYAYFGDLHVHTRFSMDAFAFGTRATPDDAYRFARGAEIRHPEGYAVQLDQPLDFYAVTDHAEYLGGLTTLSNPNHPLHRTATQLGILDESTVVERGRTHPDASSFVVENITQREVRDAWRHVVDAAQRHYEPGEFTTFIGYEYTSFRDAGNLHRNVIFGSDQVPIDIFGRLDSFNPEDLWRWMDEQRGQGMRLLSIPHNSNGSDGWMFQDVKWDGSPIDTEYASLRIRNEPLVEVTQVKGTSETHPFLSPNDEWADFEIFPYRVASWLKSRPRGSYVRDAYLTGLQVERRTGVNPYRFGVVGASDTHNGGSRFDERTYAGKVGMLDAVPERRGSVPVRVEGTVPAYRQVYRTHYGASGLTGVWADGNTREAIFTAFTRKETFATSGPRIRIRMFAGHDFPNDLITRADYARVAYARGIPQGGVLRRRRTAPELLVVAVRDPNAAPLQRLQIVKGWLENGSKRERVYDVACSDGDEVDLDTNRCPDNEAAVDISTCEISQNSGAAQLSAIWEDPDYDYAHPSFYYARVVENPTCRWSTWDAIRAGVAPRGGHPTTIQERAWTSPIWIR